MDIVRQQPTSGRAPAKITPAQRVLRTGVTAVKTALISAVVGIKVLEWWYLVAE